MTVWKNDVKLGVMQAEGLSGPLCWAVNMCPASQPGAASARLESAPVPESPTEEELVAAKEFARNRRREVLGLALTATDAECEAAEDDF